MDLDELERLLKAATAGPWEAAGPYIQKSDGGNVCIVYYDERQFRQNAALIAALRNNAEELIRDARRYREAEELGRYQDCGDKHRDWLSVGTWLYPGDRIVVVRDAIAQERKE